MAKIKPVALRNRLFSFVSAAIIALNSIPFVNLTTANAANSATNSGSVFFPAVADGSNEAAKLYHDDTLVDNGDGTFTFTSKISSAYSYSDYSESRLKSKDGEYILDKAGKYLIEVWGGDGGDGSRSLLTGRNGVGGKGGFVYGILTVSEEDVNKKKLVYEIGSKGESSTFQLDGGGTGGVGGGAGQITFISIGAGGGYSAVYLLDKSPTDPEQDEKLDPADLKSDTNLRDNPAKVLMIAGGGGGGAAGGNGAHFYELFLKAKGDGGDGGSKDSAIQAAPNIGAFTTGKYYSGADGTSAGGNTKYVGHGGTDKPGESTHDALNIIKGEAPNDWQRLYIEDGERGAGSAGNLRGAGGGAGFAGGSGGLQNAMLDANNVGGGGGGSSYTAEMANFTPFATLTANQEPYFVQPDGNTNADVGGAVVIRYLPDDADYDYLNDVKISGTVSSYFDIQSATCTDKDGNAITVNQSGAENRTIDFTGSVKPVGTGIAKGQADDSLTLKLVLKPITGFMGGNKVQIFDSGTFDCETQVAGFNEDCNFTYDDSVKYVNIPFKYKAGAKSGTFSYRDDYATTPIYGSTDIIDSSVTNTIDTDFANSVSPQYVAAVNGTEQISDFTVADYNTKGLHKFDVVVAVVPKYDGTDYVGTANPNPTYIRARSVIEIIEGEELDGFNVKASKSLDYNTNGTANDTSDDTYDFKVDLDIASQDKINKSFSIDQAIPSVQVLDLVLGNASTSNSYISLTKDNNTDYSGTLQPGIYYIEAWGGDGGSGQNTIKVTSNNRTRGFTHGGYGGKGGYISGYVVLTEEKDIAITLGAKGVDSTSNTAGGEGGEATFVWIDQDVTTEANAGLIAGGGGGGSNYLDYGFNDGYEHMGYCGNDGKREDGISAYRGIPSESDYGNNHMEDDDVYYKTTNDYKGDNGWTVEAGYSGTAYHSRINETFDNDNVAKYFAKGGNSVRRSDKGFLGQPSSTIYDKLFINSGSANISLSALAANVVNLNLGLYDYVNEFHKVGLNDYYISQWADNTTFNGSGDNFERISRYKGTTKADTEIATEGAVRITRLGVYGGYDYGSTPPDDLTDTTNTLDDVVDLIKDDYAVEYDRPFTVRCDFSEYFDLIANGTAYTITGPDANGKYTGTYTYNFTNANVGEVTHSSSTDSSTFAGYSVVTNTYTYGLQGTDSVTFKLQRKSTLVGGNDIPLLDKTINEPSPDDGTTAVKIEHHDTTIKYPEPEDDELYLPENDATDYANVAIKDLIEVADPIPTTIVDCGTDPSSKLGNVISFNGYPDDNTYTFVDTDIDTAPSGAVTEDCTRTVIGTIKPKAAATKAVKIPSVEAVSKPAEADIKVRYAVTKVLSGVEQQGSVQYIIGEADPTNIVADANEAILGSTEDKLILDRIHDAYVLKLTADSSHELPKASEVTVKYPDDKDVDANVTKSKGVITVTIPRSSFTNNITITAAGVEKKKYHVHYYYEFYDPNTPNMIQSTEYIDPKDYYVSEIVDDCMSTLTPNPADYPPWGGYENYYWEWSDEVTSGSHTIVDGDLYVTGKFVKKNIPLTITYQYEGGTEAAPTYYSPNPAYASTYTTIYDETNDIYYFYLTPGDAYSVKSPEIDGYYPDNAVVAGIAPESGSINVTVTYKPNSGSGNVTVNYIKCDENGIPLSENNTTREFYSPTLDGEGNFNLESDIESWKSTKQTADSKEYQIIRRTKLDDNKEVDVDSISGKLASGEKAVFYVYYRPKPPTATVRFNAVDEDHVEAVNRPDEDDVSIGMSSRNVVPGREYGYDPDENRYVGLPTPECRSSGADWISSGWKFVGWYDSAGNPVDETTIVPSGIDPIDLYAHWQPLQVTITIDYRYANNIEAPKVPGAFVTEIDANPKQLVKAYGMVYKVDSPDLTSYGYTADPKTVEGEATESKTETVYYKDSNASEDSVKKLKVNVYSETYRSGDTDYPTTNAPKLTGGEFALYDGNDQVGALKLNEDGTLTWSNVEANIQENHTYIVKCETPPTGYGCTSSQPFTFTPVQIQSSNEYVDEVNIFLDKSPFQLPMAGGKPLTGYTVCGISTMLLAAFLLFLYVSSKSEEENEKD